MAHDDKKYNPYQGNNGAPVNLLSTTHGSRSDEPVPSQPAEVLDGDSTSPPVLPPDNTPLPASNDPTQPQTPNPSETPDPPSPTPQSNDSDPEVPTQPAEDSLGNPADDGSTSNSDYLVEKARTFLQSPDIRGENEERKRSFLERKGLHPDDIRKLLRETAAAPPPPLPPRSYPGAVALTRRQRTMPLVKHILKISAISATFALLVYLVLLPRLSKVLYARSEIQRQRSKQLSEVEARLEEAIDLRKDTNEKIVEADVRRREISLETPIEPKPDHELVEEEDPTTSHLVFKLHSITTSLQSIRFARQLNRDRADVLQNATNLTGYIGSRMYPTTDLTNGTSRNSKRAALGPLEEEVRAEIRALKGLALNRRSFTSGVPPVLPANVIPAAAS